MAQGGTTTIKPTAPLQMPNEQKWARELGNNRQASAVADSSALQNQNLNPNAGQENINQDLIQGLKGLNVGSIKEVLGQATGMAGQQLTREALRQSWYNLIDSYGLTIIYINFHFIMTYLVKSKYFCKFGVALSPGGKTGAVSKVDGGISEMLAEYAEIIGLFAIDGLILFVLFLIACIISLIVWAATNPTEFVSEMGISAIGQIIVDLIRQ